MIQSAAMIPSSDGAARVPWHVTPRGSCRWRGHDDGCQEPGDTPSPAASRRSLFVSLLRAPEQLRLSQYHII